MEFEHEITFCDRPEIRSFMERIGMTSFENLEFMRCVRFVVTEDHPHWQEIDQLIKSSKLLVGDRVSTHFTSEERDGAKWFMFESNFYQGYPQPEDEWLDTSFDLSAFCEECKVGAKQKRPFIMKRRPSLGRNGVMQIYGIQDEVFAKPDVYADVFLPYGMGKRDVVTRKGEVINSVVQLDVGAESVSMDTSGFKFIDCMRCGRRKHFMGEERGFLPPLRSQPSGHFTRVQEYFGLSKVSLGFRPILVSQTLRRAIEFPGVRGAYLTPLANNGA